MFNSVFKVVYFVELVIISIVRKIYTAKFKKSKLLVDKKTIHDLIFLGLNGIGMLVPIVFVFSTVLDFANYYHPEWLKWIGAVLFGFAIWLLWRSHADLGKNWTPTLGICKDHGLITSGVFKYIRHPMYAAHLIWAVAQIMLLANWIAGYSFLLFQIPLYLFRVKNEENMMLSHFGDKYCEYMSKTGRFIPRFWR